MKKQIALKIILSIVGLAIFLAFPLNLPNKIGDIDFRPYWSSSFLLAYGEDFSDTSKLDSIERELTGWNENYTMFAWFAPTGNLLLLPYTLFPFSHAVYYWLITNIIIVFLSSVLIWQDTNLRMWVPIVAVFSFSMTLLSLIFGQVNTVVMLGLALFLFFSKSRYDYLTGASLVLTTIKPHLLILTLPLLLLDIVRHKQWRVLAGFIGTLTGCMLILFYLYPNWAISFWHVVASGMNLIRETPTLPGLLTLAGGHAWGKWIWVIGLFLAVIIWWKYGREWDRRSLIDITILIGMMITPVGWSYDQIMLLFPILHILKWVVNRSLTRKTGIIVATALVIINIITFWERLFVRNEVWFFWVPLAIAIVYIFARQNKLSGSMTEAS